MQDVKKIAEFYQKLSNLGIEVKSSEKISGNEEPVIILCAPYRKDKFLIPGSTVESCSDCHKTVTIAASSREIFDERKKRNLATKIVCTECLARKGKN